MTKERENLLSEGIDPKEKEIAFKVLNQMTQKQIKFMKGKKKNDEKNKKAVVLGGGGHFGIAWELGYLRGLEEGGLPIREADILLGLLLDHKPALSLLLIKIGT